MPSNSFKNFILEQLSPLPVKARPMFDAFGLYLEGKFFGIIHDSSLFFKTDQQTKKEYIKYGSKPFAPSPKQILKNYYEVPAEIIDDPSTLQEWAIKASKIWLKRK